MAPMKQNHHPASHLVFRHLAFPVCTFDRLKDYQRQYEARTGQRLTLVQTITAIVREHQANEDCDKAHDSKQPTILRGL